MTKAVPPDQLVTPKIRMPNPALACCGPAPIARLGGSPESLGSRVPDQALAALLISISVTNVYNRLNVSTRQVAGAWGWSTSKEGSSERAVTGEGN